MRSAVRRAVSRSCLRRGGSQDQWWATGGCWARDCVAGVCVRVRNWAVRGDRALLGGQLGSVHYGAEVLHRAAADNMLGGTAATGKRRRDSHKAGRWDCACASSCFPSPAQWRGIAQRQLHRVARVPTAGLVACTGLSAVAGGQPESNAPRVAESPPAPPTAPSKREPAPVLGP